MSLEKPWSLHEPPLSLNSGIYCIKSYQITLFWWHSMAMALDQYQPTSRRAKVKPRPGLHPPADLTFCGFLRRPRVVQNSHDKTWQLFFFIGVEHASIVLNWMNLDTIAQFAKHIVMWSILLHPICLICHSYVYLHFQPSKSHPKAIQKPSQPMAPRPGVRHICPIHHHRHGVRLSPQNNSGRGRRMGGCRMGCRTSSSIRSNRRFAWWFLQGLFVTFVIELT